MNDTALDRFIERRDQPADLLGVGFARAPDFFLKRPKSCPHASILTGAGKRLSSTFGS
jgi:hypothetical protein